MEPNTPTYRQAEVRDQEEIVALYRALVGTPFCTWTPTYPSPDNVASDIRCRALHCLSDANRIVAVAAARVNPELDSLAWDPRLKKPCDLARIGVHPDFQKRGLASMLLTEVIAKTRQDGYDGMRLLVGKTNKPALRLYEKAGFSLCGETVAYDIDWFCSQLVFASMPVRASY